MGDIQRSDASAIILRDNKLKRQNTELLLSEKLNQIKQLEVRIDHLKTVDIKEAEFRRDVVSKEVEEIQQQLRSINV